MNCRLKSFILLLAASALACLPQAETETEYVDEGMACLVGEADVAHTVTVDFPICLSSTCDTLLESSCSVELAGSQLTISASATVSSKSGACSADCGLVQAMCETPPLPAGTYDLVFGDRASTLTVPAAAVSVS